MKNVRHRSLYSRPAALFLAFAVCMTLIGTFLPTMAQAADSGTCGENATWSLDRATGTLTISGTGAMENYDSLRGLYSPWTYDDVKTVEIKNGITHIGDYAFCAFSNGKQLTSVIIPDSVTSIGHCAFEGCGFSTFQIPKNVTAMSGDAFIGCPNLKEFSVAEGNTAFCAIGGFLYDITGTTLVRSPWEKTEKVTIPSTVKRIGDYSFAGHCELTSVMIPEGVTAIGEHAFWNCRALKEILLPSTLSCYGAAHP